jgi:hypothetical protein
LALSPRPRSMASPRDVEPDRFPSTSGMSNTTPGGVSIPQQRPNFGYHEHDVTGATQL